MPRFASCNTMGAYLFFLFITAITGFSWSPQTPPGWRGMATIASSNNGKHPWIKVSRGMTLEDSAEQVLSSETPPVATATDVTPNDTGAVTEGGDRNRGDGEDDPSDADPLDDLLDEDGDKNDDGIEMILGISEKDVDELVKDCLKDPSINVMAIPDFLERQVYRTTIKITLNFVYRLLRRIHGARIMGHEFELQRLQQNISNSKQRLSEIRDQVDEDVLEEVVDRLLANKAINQTLVPDALERQLYMNCLKIIFRLLNLIAATFCITVCGHEIQLTVEPERTDVAVEQRVTSSVTHIDSERILTRVSQRAGLTAKGDRWYQSKQLSVQLKLTVYSLILGIVDDLLANTEVELLSDRLRVDLVPSTGPPPKPNGQASFLPKKRKKQKRTVLKQIVTFLVGVGVGVALR